MTFMKCECIYPLSINRNMNFDQLYSIITEERKRNLMPFSKNEKKILKITKRPEKYGYGYNIQLSTARGFNVGYGSLFYNKDTQSYNFHIELKKSHVHKGYGPLIYDVIIEFVANYLKSRLVPSSVNRDGGNSQHSKNIYRYYVNRRPDVQKVPLTDNTAFRLNDDESLNYAFMKPLHYIPNMLKDGTLIIDI